MTSIDILKYFSFLAMMIYDISVLYTLSPFSTKGWEGLGHMMIVYFATLPVFILSAWYLSYFLTKNQHMNAVIPGITCAIIILAGLYLFIR